MSETHARRGIEMPRLFGGRAGEIRGAVAGQARLSSESHLFLTFSGATASHLRGALLGAMDERRAHQGAALALSRE